MLGKIALIETKMEREIVCDELQMGDCKFK